MAEVSAAAGAEEEDDEDKGGSEECTEDAATAGEETAADADVCEDRFGFVEVREALLVDDDRGRRNEWLLSRRSPSLPLVLLLSMSIPPSSLPSLSLLLPREKLPLLLLRRRPMRRAEIRSLELSSS